MAGKRIKCTDKEIIEASETTMSAFEASRKLGINYKTYRTYAIRLNCFKTNQSGKGMDKKSIHKPGYEFNEHYFDDIDSNLVLLQQMVVSEDKKAHYLLIYKNRIKKY